MPHLNHRRGETRRRAKQCNRRWQTAIGYWNRLANQHHRAACRRVLQELSRMNDFDDVLFPEQDETDDYWSYY